MEVVFWGCADDSEASDGMLSSVFLDPTAQCSESNVPGDIYIYLKIFFPSYTRDSTFRKRVNHLRELLTENSMVYENIPDLSWWAHVSFYKTFKPELWLGA